MKRNPLMLIAIFGLFLSLQGYSTCLCGVAQERHESSCCHPEQAASGPDVKAPCCDRCSLRSSDTVIIRESTLSGSIPTLFLVSCGYSEPPPARVISSVNPIDASYTPHAIYIPCQPRAPPVA